MDIDKYLRPRAEAVSRALPGLVRRLRGAEPRLAEAMIYSLAAGGKRLRPALLCASYELYGGSFRDALPAACALEMVHTYSLVHDDLPAMDDDDLRRGRPTSHKVFGEALAILAGDALLTDAFTVLLTSRYPSRIRPAGVLGAASALASRAGARGMVSGQAADLAAEGFLDARLTQARRRRGAELLSYIHLHKTADLLTAAVEMGAALAGAPAKDMRALSAYGRELGLCFQAADDVLDVVGDKAKLGKSGSDARNRKLTFASLYGVDEARRRAAAYMRAAQRRLGGLSGRPGPLAVLRGLAEFACGRES